MRRVSTSVYEERPFVSPLPFLTRLTTEFAWAWLLSLRSGVDEEGRTSPPLPFTHLFLFFPSLRLAALDSAIRRSSVVTDLETGDSRLLPNSFRRRHPVSFPFLPPLSCLIRPGANLVRFLKLITFKRNQVEIGRATTGPIYLAGD